MNHRATPRFWTCYRALPADIQQLADRSYQQLLQNPRHPSLHFKKIGRFWSARVGLHYRALAVQVGEECVWVWIGTHAEYDALLKQ
jgi:hypothetical protein